jgi:hypothetical protein
VEVLEVEIGDQEAEEPLREHRNQQEKASGLQPYQFGNTGVVIRPEPIQIDRGDQIQQLALETEGNLAWIEEELAKVLNVPPMGEPIDVIVEIAED